MIPCLDPDTTPFPTLEVSISRCTVVPWVPVQDVDVDVSCQPHQSRRSPHTSLPRAPDRRAPATCIASASRARPSPSYLQLSAVFAAAVE
ncbi:hypothetical protein HBI56_094990 [Parastagonospora nodorum]|nr:hypothetical protein HBH53_142020 [Parastagonospora nodorum]KAH3989562.1 hypothetical protein HBH52_018350 [Parastagonospora nodorum]KAH3998135.1 hypothetical protein HBI10_131230 [Parastagonospora nodorum]KAH4030061.1 hypothetical protein HBI13_036370 [Parastagonospora nodorum]KAH4076479.1 hypothetical protein HBH50_006300 [Parastagonospora nodorum]